MIATSKNLGRHGNIANALDKLNFKSRGETLLKPNLVAGGLAATHVDAIRAVLDSIDIDIVAEGSSVDTVELYRGLGYKKLEREYGVELIDINTSNEWDEIAFLNIAGEKERIRISRYANWNVVSLTLPKTHDHAIVTLTLKNMLGFVHPSDRSKVHGYVSFFSKTMRIKPLRIAASHLCRFRPAQRFISATGVEEERYIKGARVIHKNIVTVVNHVKPKLGIIDGFVGMEGNGPIAGDPIYWNMAIAGDPLECDAYCAYHMGFEPENVGYLCYLNVPRVEQIKVIGDKIPAKEFKPHFKYHLQRKWK